MWCSLTLCPPLCFCLVSQQQHHEGRHRQQQHGQHLPSQESCGAAEDGGLHGQDKGTGLWFFFLSAWCENMFACFCFRVFTLHKFSITHTERGHIILETHLSKTMQLNNLKWNEKLNWLSYDLCHNGCVVDKNESSALKIAVCLFQYVHHPILEKVSAYK